MKPSILSTQYNLSLGFTPAILSMLLSEWIHTDIATYLGTGTGIGIIAVEKWRGKSPLTWILLYSTTAMLILISLFTLLFGECCPARLFPLTIEISTMLPPILLLLNRKKWTQYLSQGHSKLRQRLLLGIEASIASSKVIILLGTLHFLIISGCILTSHPLNDSSIWLLYQFLPPIFYITAIILNQIGIRYFNQFILKTTYLPIVNEQGDVIGKTNTWKLPNSKEIILLPVIRIAIVAQGMLYLRQRPTLDQLSPDKLDLPIEGYLLFGESLEEGVKRLIKQSMPHISAHNIHFSLKHPFIEEGARQLIYLFLIDIENVSFLEVERHKSGKFWTLSQLDHNLKQHLFSRCFEYEYECLKEVIYTREKYKES